MLTQNVKRYKFILKSLLDYRDFDEIKRNRFNIIRLIYNKLKKKFYKALTKQLTKQI
jgi:hypothetical protein